MKKKNFISKGLLGLSASGIIAASCSNDELWSEPEPFSEYLNSFNDEGEAAININLNQE